MPRRTPVQLAPLLSDTEINPLRVADELDAATGKEWRDWLPEAIRDFVGLGEDDVQAMDKIMAVQVGLTNPDVFDNWKLFYACTIAFNHRRVNFSWLDKPSVLELAWSCEVLRGLNQQQNFGPSVLRFIGAAMLDDGFAFFPWIGGNGLTLCDDENGEWAKGITDDRLCELGKRVRVLWEAGKLQDLEPSDVDDEDEFQVQLAKVVRAQAYIRSQHPRGRNP